MLRLPSTAHFHLPLNNQCNLCFFKIFICLSTVACTITLRNIVTAQPCANEGMEATSPWANCHSPIQCAHHTCHSLPYGRIAIRPHNQGFTARSCVYLTSQCPPLSGPMRTITPDFFSFPKSL